MKIFFTNDGRCQFCNAHIFPHNIRKTLKVYLVLSHLYKVYHFIPAGAGKGYTRNTFVDENARLEKLSVMNTQETSCYHFCQLDQRNFPTLITEPFYHTVAQNHRKKSPLHKTFRQLYSRQFHSLDYLLLLYNSCFHLFLFISIRLFRKNKLVASTTSEYQLLSSDFLVWVIPSPCY